VKIEVGNRMRGIERTLIRQINDSAPKGAINLGLGQPDLPTPSRISLAGIEGITSGRTAYTSTAGDPAVRSAVAARYGSGFTADNVVVTAGSEEAVFATMLTLLDAGDEVLIPDPGYPAYAVIARMLGAVPVSVPLRAERAFRLDPEEIARSLSPRSRLVIVCSPSNPTGAVDTAEDLARLASILEERSVAWLSDEIYAGFAYDGPIPSLRSVSPEGGIVVSGVSKDLSMTGWRIGWALGPVPVVTKIIAAHQYMVTCASSVSQAAALAALAPESEVERAEYLEIFRARRTRMADELAKLPGIRFHLPGGAFYFFVDVSRYGSSLALAKRILDRRGVITIPGEAFGKGGEGFLRISFAASDEDIRRGIRAIGEELAVS
jgi:aspartate aminotransferase